MATHLATHLAFHGTQELLLNDFCLLNYFTTPDVLLYHSVSKTFQLKCHTILINRPLRYGTDLPIILNITKTRKYLGPATIKAFKTLQHILRLEWQHPYLLLPPGDIELPETGEFGRDRRLLIKFDDITIVGAAPIKEVLHGSDTSSSFTRIDQYPTKIYGQIHISSSNVILRGLSIRDQDTGGIGILIIGKKQRSLRRKEYNRVFIHQCEIKLCDLCAIKVTYGAHCTIDECLITRNRNGIESYATMNRFNGNSSQSPIPQSPSRFHMISIVNSEISSNYINGVSAYANTEIFIHDNKKLQNNDRCKQRQTPNMSVHHNGQFGLHAAPTNSRIVIKKSTESSKISYENGIFNQFAPETTGIGIAAKIVTIVATSTLSKQKRKNVPKDIKGTQNQNNKNRQRTQ
tara:strand:+ start:107 stop:1318 length:1212 start_codon:yes stop_codon:yes gene_type:complete